MKKLLFLFVLSLIVLACGGGEDAAGEAPTASTPAKPKKEINAKKLWKINCISCHGATGNMGVNGAANLQESDKDLDYRINIITNGSENGVMTAFGEVLEADEIEALAKYSMSFKKD